MTRTGEPRLAVTASWISILCSFVLSATTWVALAELAGFSHRTSWAMVGVVDAYVVSALVLWTMSTNRELAAFARKNTYAAAIIGVVVQSGYHGATVETGSPADAWKVPLALAIGAIPPAFAALGIHMRSLGLIAKRTGTDTAKLTAGLLELSLIHAAADTAATVMAERAATAAATARVAELELALAAATVAPEPEPVVTVDPVTPAAAATPAQRPAAAVSGTRARVLAWLADNPGASAQKIVAEFGVSERTAFRYLAARTA